MELIPSHLSAAFVSNTQAVEREKEEDGKALFFLQEGLQTTSPKNAFCIHPFEFWEQNKDNMWAHTLGFSLAGLVWRRRVAFNPQNQFASSKPHRIKCKHTLRGLAPDTGEK